MSNHTDKQANLAARAAQGEEYPLPRDPADKIIGAVCACGFVGLLVYVAWMVWRMVGN